MTCILFQQWSSIKSLISSFSVLQQQRVWSGNIIGQENGSSIIGSPNASVIPFLLPRILGVLFEAVCKVRIGECGAMKILLEDSGCQSTSMGIRYRGHSLLGTPSGSYVDCDSNLSGWLSFSFTERPSQADRACEVRLDALLSVGFIFGLKATEVTVIP